MKIEKNKIIFVLVILFVVLFIGAYSIIYLGEEEEPTIENNQIPIPRLEDKQKEYDSKLEAIDDLKEVKQSNAPSIYDERLLDSMGVYDPDLLEKEKLHMVDSIFNEGHISYSSRSFRSSGIKIESEETPKGESSIVEEQKTYISVKELGLEHQLFFAANPMVNEKLDVDNNDDIIYVRVDGTQTVKKDFRLQMRLTKDVTIDGLLILKNTPIYGFVSFKPNRTMITIENINQVPVKLKAFDLQDGSEGVYTENSFQAEARQQVVGDVVEDINLAGVPQVHGIKKIFQRNNRTVKVTIADNYQLILASKLH